VEKVFELVPILAIVVPNEIFRFLVPRSGFPQLLGGPFIGRVDGDSSMDNAPCLVMHDDEDVERLEEESMHDGEITGPYILGMVSQKRSPVLA